MSSRNHLAATTSHASVGTSFVTCVEPDGRARIPATILRQNRYCDRMSHVHAVSVIFSSAWTTVRIAVMQVVTRVVPLIPAVDGAVINVNSHNATAVNLAANVPAVTAKIVTCPNAFVRDSLELSLLYCLYL